MVGDLTCPEQTRDGNFQSFAHGFWYVEQFFSVNLSRQRKLHLQLTCTSVPNRVLCVALSCEFLGPPEHALPKKTAFTPLAFVPRSEHSSDYSSLFLLCVSGFGYRRKCFPKRCWRALQINFFGKSGVSFACRGHCVESGRQWCQIRWCSCDGCPTLNN